MRTLGSMFSGIGLLDIGLERAGMRTIWHAETDANASKVLRWRWPTVPNLGDVQAIDFSTLERPDVLCGGGWPCQPFSSAGKGLGTDDPRYLWPEVARAIGDLQPRVFVMEQSSMLVSADKFRGAWERCLGDLADLGYDAKWTCLRASDLGAPHQRRRLFLAAYPRSSAGRQVPSGPYGDETEDGPQVPDLSGSGSEAAPNPNGDGRKSRDRGFDGSIVGRRLRLDLERSGTAATHPTGKRRQRIGSPRNRRTRSSYGSQVDWAQYGPAIRRWEPIIGRPAPPPLDEQGRLNVELTEWMMGAPSGWTNHLDGGLKRTAAIKCLGNGVVVQVGTAVGQWVLAGMPDEATA